MKNGFVLLALTTSSLMLGACSKYEKNPVSDLEKMRAQGKIESEKGDQGPQTIIRTVVVEKPVEVIKEQSKIDQNSIVITPDRQMTFIEGESSTFQITGRSLVPGVGIKLAAKNLPAGAVFQAAPTAKDKDRYTITWAPKFGTIANTSFSKYFTIKVYAQITSAPTEQDRKNLESLLLEKEVDLQVQKNQTPPSELTIDLANQVNENSQTSFSVSVKVPGYDDQSASKPRLTISYDGVSLTPGNKYLELDGSRHILSNQTQTQYMGNYVWKYTLIFDTKNVSVQPPVDTKNQTDPTAQIAHVRLTFKVSNVSGLSTPEVTKQIVIALAKPVAAPRFDLPGLVNDSLELTPGETTKYAFSVSAGDTNSTLRMEIPNTKTLAGSPQITCATSSLGAYKQDCSLTWKVPCAATDAELAQNIIITALATANGRSSEPVPSNLKTVRSIKEKTNCTVGVKK